MQATGLIAQLDTIVAGRHLLDHPFYQAWTAGTLSRTAMRDYAAQYYRHVEAFPRYLSALHSRCDDLSVRQALLENLIEEERGPRNHPELWMRFAEGFGVSRDAVCATTPRDSTRQLVAAFTRLTSEGPLSAGLAALYVYESQMPALAAVKIDGLRRFYGVTYEDTYSFFSVHQEADVEHSQTTASLIVQLAQDPETTASALEAAREATGALWAMLDGIPRD